MTTSSESLRGKGIDPADWRTQASRDELLSMIDREKAMAASMARTMTTALDRLAQNRALLVQVVHHEATRGHPLYSDMAAAAHESLPNVLGRRVRAGDELTKALRQAINTGLQSCLHGFRN